ncbi:MAG: pyridoxamine 5'-phosphate oxidase family protein [Pseudomonadota bacterium]
MSDDNMMDPDEFYTKTQRKLQEENEALKLGDAVVGAIVRKSLEPPHIEFIEKLDYFFLSTVSSKGEPTVSYKGGPVGFVKALDETTLMFPNYDGNGMFFSMGNVQESKKLGMLFIDMETPQRIRVQGTASITTKQSAMEVYPGSNMVVLVKVDSVFYNCARYIHSFKRAGTSKYVPDEQGNQPFPAWKRIELLQDVLVPKDQGRAEQEGGTITQDDYNRLVSEGDS